MAEVATVAERVARATAARGPGLARLRDQLSRRVRPLEELRLQNREVLASLEEERTRRAELVTVNRDMEQTATSVLALYDELSGELEATNRGVVALYAEIDDKNRQLGAASEAKTTFLRNISHELRTPGHSVLGLTRLLLDEHEDPLTAAQREQVRFIEASALDLVRLVNELLDLARAESGQVETASGAVDLTGMFDELRGTIGPLVTRPGVELVISDPGEVGRVRTDRILVAHVLRNLLSNAVKFTEAGQVHLWAERGDEEVRITVRDTGIGISDADQARVFEEFFQVRGPLQAGVRGTGLGLPYARQVSHLLGGELDLTSAPGAGSSFVLHLPLAGPPELGPEVTR